MEALFIIGIILTAIIIGYLLFGELCWYISDGEFILIKKCNDCNKNKFRWKIARKKSVGYYSSRYEYTCNKCLEKEKIQEEFIKRKKNEYKREDQLIDTLYSHEERIVKSLRRNMFNW